MVKQDDIDIFLSAKEIGAGVDIVFLDEGAFISPEETGFKDQVFNITVETPKKEQRSWTMNKTSRRMVIAMFGDDSKSWVGKKVRLETSEVMIQGKKKQAIFVVGEEKK